MASGSSYPSPSQMQMTGDGGPFYHNQHQGREATPNQEVADDLQLRADLSRSLAPILGHLPHAQHDPNLSQLSPSQYEQEHGEEQAQLGPDVLGLDGHQASPDQQDSDAANRGKDKRQKVSRACDECRRKKIRCDAPNETASEPCANCKRTNALCAFSRQPMKRGPSKGYIKELADRLNSLESQMQPPHMTQHHAEMAYLQQQLANEGHPEHQHTFDMQLQQSPAPQLAGTKRTHDDFQGSSAVPAPQDPGPRPYSFVDNPRPPTYAPQNPYTEQQRPAQYQSMSGPQTPVASMEHRPLQPPQPTQVQQHNYGAMQPFFKYGGDTGRRESVSIPYDTGGNAAAPIQDWDEDVVDEYYRIIHQTFPLLPHSKHRLRLRISECPPSLREAFLTVLGCYMRTFPSSSLRANQPFPPAMKRAAEQLAGYPFDNPSSHTPTTNLVYLQTLLLMALESDNHGPATMRGQAGPSRAEWLGRAAGVAGQLEINLIRPRERFTTEGDPDSEERIARRVWWVLFILDRWHASSTADLLKLPENSVVLLPEDQILLGESTYHLARLSFIIGHLAAILTTTKTPETNVMAPSNPASQLLGLTLAGEIDRFRESVESVWGSLNLVHLSYHHSHLLIKRLNPVTEPTELIGHALKVATVLNQRQTPITPLNHHFAALSAMTLCELVDVPKTRVDALKGLDQMSEALGLGRGLAGHQESVGWDGAIRELVLQKRANLEQSAQAQGLSDGMQQLADSLAAGDGNTVPAGPLNGEGNNVAATSGGGGFRGQGKFDPTMLTRYGYLTALAQGMFHTR